MLKFVLNMVLLSLLALILSAIYSPSYSQVYKRKVVEVRPYQSQHLFEIKAEKNIHNLQVLSCHRHFYKKKKSKFLKFKANKRVTFNYKPVSIERDNFCPLIFGVFGQNGLKDFMFIDFMNPKYTLTAVMLCNGEVSKVNGIAVCQTRRNLTQVVEFEKATSASSECLTRIETKKRFELKATGDRCTYFFKSDDKLARVSLLAYDRVQ